MIKLNLEPYCEDCNHFDVKIVQRSEPTFSEKRVYYIQCKNNNLCKNMKNYLERAMKEEQNEKTI